MTDPLDDFLEYDLIFGVDVVKCPKCGEEISSSLLLDDEIECPKCGYKFKKSG